MKVDVEVSARHMHLTREDLEFLFGEGYELTKYKDISQSHEYASTDEIDIKSDEGTLTSIRVLGPVRDYTQVEISRTDAFNLGLEPPVRNSGDIEGSCPITICNNGKELKKKEGCIIAARHIHMSVRDSFKLGFRNNQRVKVKLTSVKGGILDNVFIKIKDTYVLKLHIDTDDANANLVTNGDICEVIDDE